MRVSVEEEDLLITVNTNRILPISTVVSDCCVVFNEASNSMDFNVALLHILIVVIF